MTPNAVRHHSPITRLLLCAATLLMMMSLPASTLEPETCFSRQHQGATVNVRLALNRTATAMNTRLVRSERDCVLVCCSEVVKTGLRCNTAVFMAIKHANDDNCLLFHCPSEQDCPLMKASDDINTYDIYKGLSHPPTLFTTTTSTKSTTGPTSTTTSTATTPTTIHLTTTPTTTTTQAPPLTTEPPPSIIISSPMPAVTSHPTTAATTTTEPSPTVTPKKPNKTSKKQNKTTKKGKAHPLSTVTTTRPAPSSTSSLPVVTTNKDLTTPTTVPSTTTAATTTTSTTTTTTTTATTTTTTATTTTTTATTTTTTTTTTAAAASTTTTTARPTTTSTTTTTPTTTESSTTTASPTSLNIVPKDMLQSDHILQFGPAHKNSNISRGKSAAAQGALKSGLVAFMVLGLAMLILALAVGCRKAVESFDRRHYTRLELNDLHYEI